MRVTKKQLRSIIRSVSSEARRPMNEGDEKFFHFSIDIINDMFEWASERAEDFLVGKRVRGVKYDRDWRTKNPDGEVVEGVITSASVDQEHDDILVNITVRTDDGREVTGMHLGQVTPRD